MTTKRKLPNLRKTGLFKVYLRFCTPEEKKALGCYVPPKAQKWSQCKLPADKINELLDQGIAPTNIARYVNTSRRVVDRIIAEREKKKKEEEEKENGDAV